MPVGLLTLTTVVHVAALALALWLALYLELAGPPRPASRLSALTLLALGVYFLLGALMVAVIRGSAELFWQRWQGTAVVLAPALWYRFTVSLLPTEERARWRDAGRLVFVPALLLMALAVFSDALFLGVLPPGLPDLSTRIPGPLFGLYVAFFALLAAGCLYNLWLRRREARTRSARLQVRWLLAATLLAGAGGTYLTCATWLGLPWVSLPGDLLLAGGILTLGLAMARYQAFVEGPAASQLPQSLQATTLVVAGYLAVTYIAYRALEIPFAIFIFVVPLAVLSHPLHHWWLTGRLGPAPPPGQLPLPDRAWVDQVEEALRRLFDFSFLGRHPLAGLTWVEERSGGETHLDRGRAVAELVQEAIARLRPQGKEDPGDRAWQGYLILQQSYVEGQPTRDVMNRLYISEATFHRYRRQAVESVAQAILEMEDAARLG